MTTMTITPALDGYATDPHYAAGRADAYDDEPHLTVDAQTARAAEYVEHAHLLRALGYMDATLERRLRHDAVTSAECLLAHTDQQDTPTA
jgi:hypothetical protein